MKVTNPSYRVKKKNEDMYRSLIITVFILLQIVLFAQEETQDYHYHLPQSNTLSLGVGVPSTTQIAVKFLGLINQDAKATPQFTLKYEYAVNKNIGIGVYGGYYTGETENISLPSIQLDSILNDPGTLIDNLFGGNDKGTSSTYRVSVLTIGAQLTYHLYRFEKLDTYTTIRGGYNIVTVKENGAKNNEFVGAQVPQFEYFAGAGLRYYFTSHLAVYGEVGNSILSPIHVNLGGTYRF